MEMVARARRRSRLEEEEGEGRIDRISSLPDAVLGEIVSLLPTKDGARTQVLSSRWRPMWRSAPLNLDVYDNSVSRRIPVSKIPRILSSHPGPGRRFSVPRDYMLEAIENVSTILDGALDGWLQSPTLNNLQELDLYDSTSAFKNRLHLCLHQHAASRPPFGSPASAAAVSRMGATPAGSTFPFSSS
ncbi:unnamed protein product [Urochloa humidicola]